MFAAEPFDTSDGNRTRMAVSAVAPLLAVASVNLGAMDAQWGDGVLAVLPELDACMEQLQQLQLRRCRRLFV